MHIDKLLELLNAEQRVQEAHNNADLEDWAHGRPKEQQ